MLFLIGEKVAALYQRFQHAEINFFVGPLTLAKESGILILLAHDVDFRLPFTDGIIAPPTAQGSEFHRGLSAKNKSSTIRQIVNDYFLSVDYQEISTTTKSFLLE